MIGIFDSGLGGLTVVRELLRQAPDASFVYLGDTANLPYGNKSAETIKSYALADADFLIAQGVTAIVIACNTASAHAAKLLRETYPTIPIFDVIFPAIEDALEVTKEKVGVIGTRATMAAWVYQGQLSSARPGLIVVAQPCPLFVPLVEEGWLEGPETELIVKRYLAPVRDQHIDTLILGCTHYPLLAPVIQSFFGTGVQLISSGASVVRRLLEAGIEQGPNAVQRYCLTEVSDRSKEIASEWLGQKIVFESVSLPWHPEGS